MKKEKAREENREVYERHGDHMVPPGLRDPSRLSHLTQHTRTFAYKQACIQFYLHTHTHTHTHTL